MSATGAVCLVVAVCAMYATAEEVDPSLEWSPTRVLRGGGGRSERAVLGLLAGGGVPDSELQLEAEAGAEGEARVAKRQAAGLDWQLLAEEGGGEARTRVKRAQLVLNSEEDAGDIEAMQEESANEGGFDVSVGGDGAEEGQAEWLERRGVPASFPGDEGKEEKCSGDEEEREVALGKNDAKPPK